MNLSFTHALSCFPAKPSKVKHVKFPAHQKRLRIYDSWTFSVIIYATACPIRTNVKIRHSPLTVPFGTPACSAISTLPKNIGKFSTAFACALSHRMSLLNCCLVIFPACTIFSPYLAKSSRGLTLWSRPSKTFGPRADSTACAMRKFAMMAVAA